MREAVGERKGGEQHPELGGAKAQVGAYRLPGDAQRRAVKKVDDTGDKQQRQGDLLHPTDTQRRRPRPGGKCLDSHRCSLQSHMK